MTTSYTRPNMWIKSHLYNKEKSEQANIPHAPLLLDSDTHNEWQSMHKIQNLVWKSITHKKKSAKTYCKYAHLFLCNN